MRSVGFCLKICFLRVCLYNRAYSAADVGDYCLEYFKSVVAVPGIMGAISLKSFPIFGVGFSAKFSFMYQFSTVYEYANKATVSIICTCCLGLCERKQKCVYSWKDDTCKLYRSF